MDIQLFLILILFIAAVFYIGRMIFFSFKSKNACAGNCKCGVDFSEIDIKKLD